MISASLPELDVTSSVRPRNSLQGLQLIVFIHGELLSRFDNKDLGKQKRRQEIPIGPVYLHCRLAVLAETRGIYLYCEWLVSFEEPLGSNWRMV